MIYRMGLTENLFLLAYAYRSRRTASSERRTCYATATPNANSVFNICSRHHPRQSVVHIREVDYFVLPRLGVAHHSHNIPN
jgi:hypothetical protein